MLYTKIDKRQISGCIIDRQINGMIKKEIYIDKGLYSIAKKIDRQINRQNDR